MSVVAPSDELTKLVSLVEKQLAAIHSATDAVKNAPHDDRRAARDKAVTFAINVLAYAGGKGREDWNGSSIRLGGIRATSTIGFSGAMSNWLTAARKRLEKDAAA